MQDGQINRHELIQALRHDPVVVKLLDLPAVVSLDRSNEHAWSGTLDMRFQTIDNSGNEIIDLDEFLAYFANGDADAKDGGVGGHEGGREGGREGEREGGRKAQVGTKSTGRGNRGNEGTRDEIGRRPYPYATYGMEVTTDTRTSTAAVATNDRGMELVERRTAGHQLEHVEVEIDAGTRPPQHIQSQAQDMHEENTTRVLRKVRSVGCAVAVLSPFCLRFRVCYVESAYSYVEVVAVVAVVAIDLLMVIETNVDLARR